MKFTFPLADAVPVGSNFTKDKILKIIQRKNLVGTANNIKWNRLLTDMRTKEGWKPSYRSKSVAGFVSDWDVEWWCHVPLPMIGIEWLDIGLSSSIHVGRLISPRVVCHKAEVIKIVKPIKFDYAIFGDILRIWGYHPRSHDLLPDP